MTNIQSRRQYEWLMTTTNTNANANDMTRTGLMLLCV